MNKGPAGLTCWDIGLATFLIPMASAQDLPRTVLPIPDREHQGLTTFDAKDPDTNYPPIQPMRPPPTEMATSAPGNNSLRPNSCAPLAEVLKLNGYATAQFGKCHEVPVWETSPAGPFNRVKPTNTKRPSMWTPHRWSQSAAPRMATT
jgi:hypothetical protein